MSESSDVPPNEIMLDVILLTVLAHLPNEPDPRQALAATRLPEPLVTAWLTRAEQRGLVTHARSRASGRAQWSLTPAGRDYLEELGEGTDAGMVQTIAVELPDQD
jgi:DNA-binding MarR family transcriptional regulator